MPQCAAYVPTPTHHRNWFWVPEWLQWHLGRGTNVVHCGACSTYHAALCSYSTVFLFINGQGCQLYSTETGRFLSNLQADLFLSEVFSFSVNHAVTFTTRPGRFFFFPSLIAGYSCFPHVIFAFSQLFITNLPSKVFYFIKKVYRRHTFLTPIRGYCLTLRTVKKDSWYYHFLKAPKICVKPVCWNQGTGNWRPLANSVLS